MQERSKEGVRGGRSRFLGGRVGDVRDEVGGEVRDEDEGDGLDDVPDNTLGRSIRDRLDDGEGCGDSKGASGLIGTQPHRKKQPRFSKQKRLPSMEQRQSR